MALEKVCFSAMQSIVAALLVIPMAYYIPAKPVSADVHHWFLLALVLVLSSLLAGSLGLVIGSTVNPKQIGLVFSIIVVPITFLGCVYYPWAQAGQDSLAADSRPLQPHRLYERGSARRGHAQHCPHAMVGHSSGSGGVYGGLEQAGPAWIPEKSPHLGRIAKYGHANFAAKMSHFGPACVY